MNDNIPTKYLIHLLFALYLFSYLFSFLINPGIPERKYYNSKNKQSDNNYKKCKKCNILVPIEFGIGHCIDCDICIKKHDHHCSWIGKCIGEGNYFAFHLYICSFFLFLIILILSIVLIFYQKFKS